MWLFSKYSVFYMWCNSESTLRNKAKSCAKKTQRLKTFGFSWQHYIKDIIIFIKESGLWVALFVPSIQDYLVRVLDKQEVFGGCWLLFLLLHFLEERWLVLGVVVLCHPCDRSLLLGCHLLSLAFLEGGVAVFCGDGSRSPGWKEVRGILSFFGDVDGYAGIW